MIQPVRGSLRRGAAHREGAELSLRFGPKLVEGPRIQTAPSFPVTAGQGASATSAS